MIIKTVNSDKDFWQKILPLLNRNQLLKRFEKLEKTIFDIFSLFTLKLINLGLYAVPTAVGDLGEAIPGATYHLFWLFFKKRQKFVLLWQNNPKYNEKF